MGMITVIRMENGNKEKEHIEFGSVDYLIGYVHESGGKATIRNFSDEIPPTLTIEPSVSLEEPLQELRRMILLIDTVKYEPSKVTLKIVEVDALIKKMLA